MLSPFFHFIKLIYNAMNFFDHYQKKNFFKISLDKTRKEYDYNA